MSKFVKLWNLWLDFLASLFISKPSKVFSRWPYKWTWLVTVFSARKCEYIARGWNGQFTVKNWWHGGHETQWCRHLIKNVFHCLYFLILDSSGAFFARMKFLRLFEKMGKTQTKETRILPIPHMALSLITNAKHNVKSQNQEKKCLFLHFYKVSSQKFMSTCLTFFPTIWSTLLINEKKSSSFERKTVQIKCRAKKKLSKDSNNSAKCKGI